MTIVHTEVDGIETVLAPGTGPLRAGLMFRIGRADETLATAGITHLVEHLALHRHGLTVYHFNGATSATETHFVVEGSPAEVVSYLNGVCAALRDLPLDRLGVEKEVLRTEASGRGSGGQLPLWRYGAQGYGLLSYPEHGLHRIGAADVTAWAERWFTRQNAVLWMTAGEVPEGLDVKLPDGERQPVPEATSALPRTPAYFTGEEAGVALQAVVGHSTAALVFSDLLSRALFRELRQEGGLSYQAASGYDARDGGHAVITAVADALPAKREAVLGGFVDVLAGLRMGRIDTAELDAVRNRFLERLNQADAAARLPGYARNLLIGHPNPTDDQARAELLALTVEDMRRIAEEVTASALVMTPAGTRGEWAGLHPAPTTSPDRVAGRHWRSLVHQGHALVVGDDGVSLISPHGQATVRYADCVAALASPDGARHLTGPDGMTVNIEPTLFALPADVIARIDASLPCEVVVPLPARTPQQIPRPPAKSATTAVRSALWYGWLADRLVRFADLLLAIAFMCVLGAFAMSGGGDEPGAVGFAVGAVLAAVPPVTIRTVRRIHARS
ncbi:insulinase family protein [Kitasatospora sp. NPDC096128]|uniref:M16 family metallopeptidase n=1 Tax=Kitasatospora sp. NPDC096128 TaxID=3155547 RepID=UPI00332DA3AF